jgi:flagellar biosynthesis/type III secretory pathway protein FliH
MATIAQEFIEQGIEQGIKQGIEQGIKQGIERGIKQGIEQSILHILQRRLGVVPSDIQAQLDRLATPELKILLDDALLVVDLDAFRQRLTAVSPPADKK